MNLSLPSDVHVDKKFGCDVKIMQQNLRTLQSLKYQVDGVKWRPYAKMKLKMHQNPVPAHLQAKLGDNRLTSPMAILSSFLQDKQLHKMLQTQVPMHVGATMMKDILTKMDLIPLIKKHLVQTAFLEAAFAHTREHQIKSQKLIQQDLEKKTLQSVTTAFLRALPVELYTRIAYDKLLESSSTVEVEAKMTILANLMKLKTPAVADEMLQKFMEFVEEVKEPAFRWPVKYIIAQKISAALTDCFQSEDFLQYALDYMSDVLFHVVYHAKLLIHVCPWIAYDRELTSTINNRLAICEWHPRLPPQQFLDEQACTSVLDKAQSHDLIKVPVTNFIEVTKGSRVFNMNVLATLFDEDIFQHQNIEVPSEYDEANAAQAVLDQNNEILMAQQTVNNADADAFQSGTISNIDIQKAQEQLKVIPPCATLARITKTSRITIRAAVAAADNGDAYKDHDLKPLFTLHLAPSENIDKSSFLARLAVADKENCQRILVQTKSKIVGYQPQMVPIPCLYSIKTTELVERKGKKLTKTVTRRCTKFACSNLPVCPLHLNMMNKLSSHDRFTPGKYPRKNI